MLLSCKPCCQTLRVVSLHSPNRSSRVLGAQASGGAINTLMACSQTCSYLPRASQAATPLPVRQLSAATSEEGISCQCTECFTAQQLSSVCRPMPTAHSPCHMVTTVLSSMLYRSEPYAARSGQCTCSAVASNPFKNSNGSTGVCDRGFLHLVCGPGSVHAVQYASPHVAFCQFACRRRHT